MANPTRAGILLALLGTAAGQTTHVTAHVHGVGADYFEADLHTFKCHVVPTDGAPEFFTVRRACRPPPTPAPTARLEPRAAPVPAISIVQ